MTEWATARGLRIKGRKGNAARRKFWERCASRAPIISFYPGTGAAKLETPAKIAEWADSMLAEWDRRWIAEAGRWRCEGCGGYHDPDPITPDGRGHQVDNADGSPGYCGPISWETERAEDGNPEPAEVVR